MKNIIAFSGSNSKNSINQKLIEATKDLETSNNVTVLSLRDYEVEVYGIDKEIENGFPSKIKDLNDIFDTADAFIVSTPEHNGSMPAALKNTIDWLSRMNPKVFREKPTLFLSTSPGPRGGATALEHMVTIMPYRGAQVIGHLSIGNFNDHYINGKLDEEIEQKIGALLGELNSAIKYSQQEIA